MTHDSDEADGVIAELEPALAGIEQGDSYADPEDLLSFVRERLIAFIRSVERDPGIEAAAADLYAAAAALVHDRTSALHPGLRKLRVFRDARARFGERLSAARRSVGDGRSAWRHQELMLPA